MTTQSPNGGKLLPLKFLAPRAIDRSSRSRHTLLIGNNLKIMASVKYCPACKRNVGLKTISSQGMGCLISVALLILGLIIPLWIITLPICWFAAFVAAIWPVFFKRKVCAICGAPWHTLDEPHD